MDIHENTIVLDLETARSADDCLHCGLPMKEWETSIIQPSCPPWCGHRTIGWNNKPALGLSIGAYWDYADSRIHWFDPTTLEATVRLLVKRQPLLVSFNGISFDFVLMRGLLRRYAEGHEKGEGAPPLEDWAQDLIAVCDTFKAHCATSYDILAEIWRVDPARKFERGLNSLDAIAQANGFGAKLSHGAQAPRDWAIGRYADVLNYCQDDVYKTKALFEQIIHTGSILRGDNQAIQLPRPRTITPM